ncbi:hypothetical protein BV20DRAFT_968364 [Pilatotrama ljubarskyi]|nr:hypothetical protein BV20DRAFT_968364 [Pilatotrama ljubarskyi]
MATSNKVPAIQDIIFPAHLRLRAGNWENYRLAVEIACRLHGVESHLDTSASTPLPADGEGRARWMREDELCKAIIIFNVENFAGLEVSTKERYAGGIWQSLRMKMVHDRAELWP